MAKAIDAGLPKLRIEEAAARTQARIDSGRQTIVGVNRYRLEPTSARSRSSRSTTRAVREAQIARLEQLRAERDRDAVERPRWQRSPPAPPPATATCSSWSVERPGPRRRSARSRTRSRGSSAATRPPSGPIAGRVLRPRSATSAARSARCAAAGRRASPRREGRRPRILVAKMGQDGHDRGQKVIATAFADLGFDVDVGPLFQTPEEVGAPGGRERRARRRRQLAGRRPPDAGAAAHGRRSSELGPRRHHDRGRRRHPAAGLTRPCAQPGRRRSSGPAP